MTKHADELYAKYYAAATEAAKVDKELRLRRALWSNHSILKARSLDHNKETGNKKKSIGRSINKLKKVLEEHVLILNSRIALGLAVGPLAAATDWTSSSFEPPASQATGTSQCSTSEMQEEFVAVYDRLARCNEQAVLNIHHTQLGPYDTCLGGPAREECAETPGRQRDAWRASEGIPRDAGVGAHATPA